MAGGEPASKCYSGLYCSNVTGAAQSPQFCESPASPAIVVLPWRRHESTGRQKPSADIGSHWQRPARGALFRAKRCVSHVVPTEAKAPISGPGKGLPARMHYSLVAFQRYWFPPFTGPNWKRWQPSCFCDCAAALHQELEAVIGSSGYCHEEARVRVSVQGPIPDQRQPLSTQSRLASKPKKPRQRNFGAPSVWPAGVCSTLLGERWPLRNPYEKDERLFGAGGGARTPTSLAGLRAFSPLRLLVPPRPQ